MKTFSLGTKRGFTLIELLLVIGIIAILASIVIVAINPTKQLADARNAQRRSDVNTLLNAIYQASIDSPVGALPGCLQTAGAGTTYSICLNDCVGPPAYAAGTGLGAGAAASCDLTTLTTGAKYLVAIPKDPGGGGGPAADSAQFSGYNAVVDSNKRITISAVQPENGITIFVQR